MFQKLALVHRFEVPRQTLSQNGVRLWCHLHNLLLWMRIDEAEIFLELRIRSLELKVCRDVTAQSKILRKQKTMLFQTFLGMYML